MVGCQGSRHFCIDFVDDGLVTDDDTAEYKKRKYGYVKFFSVVSWSVVFMSGSDLDFSLVAVCLLSVRMVPDSNLDDACEFLTTRGMRSVWSALITILSRWALNTYTSRCIVRPRLP